MFIVLGIQATAKKEQNNTTIKIISIHILQSIDRDSLKQYMNADEKKMKKNQCFIKKQKSRKLLEKLCEIDYKPTGKLAQLVRIPHMPD
jgi:hypothetical protein